MARPHKLAKYSQEEVRQKVVELGGLTPVAEFYGVAVSTVSLKVGNFRWRGVKPGDVIAIREMSKTHIMSDVAEALGYTKGQIEWAARSYSIKFCMSGKPRSNSRLTHEQMRNMDKIVKGYESVYACAKAHNVCSRTIDRHIKRCKEERKREAAHSNNQND